LPQPHLACLTLPKGLVAAKGCQVVSTIHVSRVARRLEWNIGVCWKTKLEVGHVRGGGGVHAWDFFHVLGVVPYMRYVLTVTNLEGLKYRGTDSGANEESVFLC
jgi:hypothetical protein